MSGCAVADGYALPAPESPYFEVSGCVRRYLYFWLFTKGLEMKARRRSSLIVIDDPGH